MLDDILLQVNKPARYIGQEWNVSRKIFDKAYIKFVLCFPDLYELGMSNLGLRIIYGILNAIPDVTCERIFSCQEDMQDLLRQRKLEIFSLESKKMLREFDIVGFSLGSELDYTNVLNILEMGSIPLKADSRDQTNPLVIAGGPCVLNPEPVHDFFDFFVIGEAEDLILEVIDLYRREKDKFKSKKTSRQDLLTMFAQIEGIYVPSLYEVKYNSKGAIQEFRPKREGAPVRIKKRFVKDFGASYFPSDWLVPYIQIVHDRITLEIMRGCPNSCRFCQARSQYYPLRIRNPDNVLNLARDTYSRTGYEELSLAGLSVGDYPHMGILVTDLLKFFKEKAVGISLPSLKAKQIVGHLSSLVACVKKTGLTFAPEAGTVRLRNIIGKDFDEEAFFKVIEQASLTGYRHVKLYFMIGLPTEDKKDLDAIADLTMHVLESLNSIKNKARYVNISINTLIPKPHTPLQWFDMADVEKIKDKQNYLKNKIRNKRAILNFHNRYMSFIEGILSRGDRRLSQVVLSAFKRGAKFDAWGNYFAINSWIGAFKECDIEPELYLKERSTHEFLPWDFIDIGIEKETLIQEFNKSIDIK
jgi:radical SAM family uncharacterized protein